MNLNIKTEFKHLKEGNVYNKQELLERIQYFNKYEHMDYICITNSEYNKGKSLINGIYILPIINIFNSLKKCNSKEIKLSIINDNIMFSNFK